MTRHRLNRWTLLLLLTACFTTPAIVAPLESVGDQDIRGLLERARSTYDLDNEDAIFLLDSQRDDWRSDGRRVRTIHQIVYILTEHALDSYADLRIPYDGERQKLSVSALRTWRLSDERWIESGPTAQVETLPFAVGQAPDYAYMREVMLLHDGVELPCVLETSYTIEDIESYRPGMDGIYSFAQADPVLVSRLILGFTGNDLPTYATSAGVPTPERGHDDDADLDTLTFELGQVAPLPHPWMSEMIHQTPHVVWSTWKSWEALGADLNESFTGALQLGDELRGELAKTLQKARSDSEKAQLIMELVGESTGSIGYELGWWGRPRPATRTWSTAYGDQFDRAALAAALLREAGLQAELALVGPLLEAADRNLPTLEWPTAVRLWISGEGLKGYIEPDSRALPDASMLWRPGVDSVPFKLWAGETPLSKSDLRLELSFDKENKKWKGNAVLTATGALSPFSRMVGLKTQARDYLGELAGAVIQGAEVTGYNLALFGPPGVTVGFELEAPADKRDELERLHLEIAAPAELSALLAHAAVRLHEEKRESHIALPTALEQRVELYLDLKDLAVVHLPEEVLIENEAGRFASSSGTDDEEGELHFMRSLILSGDRYSLAEWPALRTLLLAEEHAGQRLLLFD